MIADPCTAPALDVWGSVDAEDPSRQEQLLTERGTPYRRLTVLDGDDFYGERAEIGHNERRAGDLATGWDPTFWDRGTFCLYREGQVRSTRFSVRLPEDFPLDSGLWQGIGQIKQAQPYTPQGNVPMVAFSAYGGEFALALADPEAADLQHVWTCALPLGGWVHFRHDAIWSATAGRQQIRVRRRGVTVASPIFDGPNLLRAASDWRDDNRPQDTLLGGDTIPSHLRLGVYHHPEIPGTYADYRAIEVR